MECLCPYVKVNIYRLTIYVRTHALREKMANSYKKLNWKFFGKKAFQEFMKIKSCFYYFIKDYKKLISLLNY